MTEPFESTTTTASDTFAALDAYIDSLMDTATRLCIDLASQRVVGPNLDLKPYVQEASNIGFHAQEMGALWSVLFRHREEAKKYLAKYPTQDPTHALPDMLERLGKLNINLVRILAQTRRRIMVQSNSAGSKYEDNSDHDAKQVATTMLEGEGSSNLQAVKKLCATMKNRGGDLFIAASRVTYSSSSGPNASDCFPCVVQ